MAPRDRVAWVSFSLQKVAQPWTAGHVTYMLWPGPTGASGQRVAAARTGYVHRGTQLSHPIPAPAGTPCHSWGGQVGKPTAHVLSLSRPRQGLGSHVPSPWTTATLAAPRPLDLDGFQLGPAPGISFPHFLKPLPLAPGIQSKAWCPLLASSLPPPQTTGALSAPAPLPSPSFLRLCLQPCS